ncbi:hypothetical protein [Sphingobium agri]|uniref:DUF5666 domain-containing protein n=1 Tax=Sphingobium agri TaxID=2933566 RepID=A0ABT0DU97_9SPHN|nr:hypothetical protein [Sphingobium agri]MCK0530696.1 hypothetical protein [Sphingobium agri]
MRLIHVALLCAAASSTLAEAQVAVPPPSAALAVGPAAANILRTGTEIQLKMEEPLTTEGKKLRVGQHFRLSVIEPVTVGGQIVIPVGAPAMGEVTEVRNKGMWGKSGHLTASLLHVSVNGRQIRLSGTFDDKGVTGTAGVVAAVAFVPVVGFFTTGTSAKIAAGSQVKGFIGEDVPLVFAEAVTAPAMTVPVAAAVSAPAAAQPVATPAATAQ